MPAVAPTRPPESSGTAPLEPAEVESRETLPPSSPVRFDPEAGKPVGPLLDSVTGERPHSPTTRLSPPWSWRLFLAIQGVWLALWTLLAVAAAVEWIDREGLAADQVIVGAAIWWVIGALLITTIHFIYRKLRRYP
jgi:hypothetical protein